jgi:predicted nucleotidyltransferase
MLNKEQILAMLKAVKPVLQREMGVRQIGLFGSYAKDKQTGNSDVDIYVELVENDYQKLVMILLFLEQKLGVKIDLVYKRKQMRPSFLQTLERETIYAW